MEKKNYAFSFDPNKTERAITDKNGKAKMTIEGNGAPLGGDFANNSYVIANHVSKDRPKTKKKVKAPGVMTDNIGPGSSGFAGVATLAAIIAIAGVVIAYLTLRY